MRDRPGSGLRGGGQRGDVKQLRNRGRWHILIVFEESDAAACCVIVNPDQVAATHLPGGNQVLDRIHQVTFDGTFEVSRAVFQICAFPKQELFRFSRASEDKFLVRLRRHDPVLNFIQFDIQNLS